MEKNKLYKNIDFIAFTLPAFVLILISTGIPFLMNVLFAFTKWNGISKEITFVGVDNFAGIFSKDINFWKSLWFTGKITILSVIFTNILALFIAVQLDRCIFGKGFLRAMFYIPQTVSLIVIGFVWKFLFTQGFVNLYELTGIKLFNWSWLGNSELAVFSVFFVNLWESLGFFMVIYIAGLQAIPQDVNEAANVDGASGLKKFFYVTLPLLKQSIISNITFAILGGMKIFDIIVSLTGGGPGRDTVSVSYDIYMEAFSNNRYGYATAKSLIFFILVLGITLVLNKIADRMGEDI